MMQATTLHVLWGEQACALYRRGVIDARVKIAHCAYKFENAAQAQAFLYGIRESRKRSDWMLVEDMRGIQALGIPPRTRLIEAILKGDDQAVEQILKDGVSPDSRASNGMTALAVAASVGAATVVSKLLDFGANIDDPGDGPNPMSALHVACTSNAAQAGKCVELISEKADKLDAPGPDGKTPLILAIEHQNYAGANALLKEGARPTVTDELGRTPQEILRQSEPGDPQALQLLNILARMEEELRASALRSSQIISPPKPTRFAQ